MNDDLISREALKNHKFVGDRYIQIGGRNNGKTLGAVNRAYRQGWNDAIDAIIDNAPTVDITEEQAIDKLHETGWLPMHDKEMTEKPQGEWIDHSEDGYVECPFCGCLTNCEGNIDELHYCWNCGAELGKGGADCMDEDAKQASIPYTYNAPQHDWKCGYPDITRCKGGAE